MSDSDDFLEHYGVRGMKWGKRKKRPPLTQKQKLVRTSVALAGAIAVDQALKRGARWAINNPEKIAVFAQRGKNYMNGTKALTTGYKVVKIAGGGPQLIPI